MAEQSNFARRMMAQKLMTESRDDPFSDSQFFNATPMLSPDDMMLSGPQGAASGTVTPGQVAYGVGAAGSLFAPGAGVADVMGFAPDPFNQGQMLPSFGENVRQGKYLDAGLQTLGVAGDVMMAGGTVFPPAAAVGAALKAPRVAKVAGAAMDLAQARYFETGKFEPPTAENPVSVVLPTETEPGIIAFHGSGADFDEFRLEMIGTGEGAQAYGYGLYFTDSEDIAKFYRESISRGKSGIPQSVPENPDDIAGELALDINFNKGLSGDTKELQINSSDPDYDFYIETLNDNAVKTTQAGAGKTFEFTDGSIISLLDETMPVFNGKALDSVYISDVQDVFGAEIADIAQRAKDMGIPGTLEQLTDDVTTVFSQLGQGLGSKRDMDMAVESLAPSGPGAPSRFKTIYNQFIEPKSTIETTSTVTELGSKKGKMYKVALSPKTDELLDYDTPLNQQPRPVQKQIKNLVGDLLAGEPEAYNNFDFPALAAIQGDTKSNWMGQKIPPEGYSPNGDDILRDLKKFFESQDFQNELYGRGDRLASELMTQFGIPGIKYFDNTSRNTAGGKLIDVTEAKDGFRAKVAVENRTGGLGGSGRIVTTSPPYKTRQEALDWADEATKRSSRNYVIFDDKSVKILEKYGIVGPVAVTAAGTAAVNRGRNDNDNDNDGSIFSDAGMM